jgi:hypothetical protein
MASRLLFGGVPAFLPILLSLASLASRETDLPLLPEKTGKEKHAEDCANMKTHKHMPTERRDVPEPIGV